MAGRLGRFGIASQVGRRRRRRLDGGRQGSVGAEEVDLGGHLVEPLRPLLDANLDLGVMTRSDAAKVRRRIAPVQRADRLERKKERKVFLIDPSGATTTTSSNDEEHKKGGGGIHHYLDGATDCCQGARAQERKVTHPPFNRNIMSLTWDA